MSFPQSDQSITNQELEREPAENNVEFEFNVPRISINELPSNQKELQKDFKIGFKLKKPGKIIETHETLGTPQIIDNKAFDIVFKAIYRTITSKTYEMSLGIENKK